MPRRSALLLTLLACGPQRERSATDEAQNEPGLRLALCGTVESYDAPGPGADGSLAVDDREWSVAADARRRHDELLVPGSDVCLYATIDRTRRIVALDVARAPETNPWARLPQGPQ